MQMLNVPESALEDSLIIDKNILPKHVAIIMDGNRRWAKKNGLPNMMGHWQGAKTIIDIVTAAIKWNIKALTVFAFSTENWQRSQQEIDSLMYLCKIYLRRFCFKMIKEQVRLQTIGDLTKIPKDVYKTICDVKKATENGNRIDLVLAINYGGRDDIKRALVNIVEDVQSGLLSRSEINEQLIAQYLDTSYWPDPDLLIRTSGEKRQSNFLLWQLSYSEFYHTEVLWPDFSEKELIKALYQFQQRQRRFGGL
ncbi:MAG: isoprenyl transferase [Candidatus Rhabdochlamydia oedothoracis]|nr:isoprenyl transferase [Candidatus Rhabdochlamydia oedothoracis]